MHKACFIILTCLLLGRSIQAAEPMIKVWPGKPPGETKSLPPEEDIYKPTDKKIAGRPIIKLANVSTPTLEVFQSSTAKATGAAAIICPGGGHHILAYDLEGVEVARWLSSLGVTAIVLKYRVPAREKSKRWRAAVQDAQRAVSLVRSRAKKMGVDPKRIGIGGFSAGGETAGLTALFGNRRTYDRIDNVDDQSCRPDFAFLIYPGGLVKREAPELQDHVKVGPDAPPMFFVHAMDDRVSPLSSILLCAELQKANVPAELHVFAKGGHGYGLRPTEMPVTRWPRLMEVWLQQQRLLK